MSQRYRRTNHLFLLEDPLRLPSELEDDLRRARADGPSEETMQRLAERLRDILEISNLIYIHRPSDPAPGDSV